MPGEGVRRERGDGSSGQRRRATVTLPPALMREQPPLSRGVAWRAMGHSIAVTVKLLAERRVHLRSDRVGARLRFADGTSAQVYRETVVDSPDLEEPCVLLVEFRLRGVRGKAHAAFRLESQLNTPLFVGFRGFVSKLWLTHDQRGVYRGLYQWASPALAERYARCLWHALALVCVRESIHYAVLPGLDRDELLSHRDGGGQRSAEEETEWWRLVGVT